MRAVDGDLLDSDVLVAVNIEWVVVTVIDSVVMVVAISFDSGVKNTVFPTSPATGT
jgi:hypothetical protein